MTATFTILAAILGFLGVALGAFDEHALSSRFADQPRLEANYRTGAQYHLIHALAVFGVAWANSQWNSGLLVIAGWLFVLGIVLFSGSLYEMALTGNRKLGAITPLGGLAFLGGWLCLALGVVSAG
jgi:uncharacterized membrane protein YgdD (TMEM256/DUF423 family)